MSNSNPLGQGLSTFFSNADEIFREVSPSEINQEKKAHVEVDVDKLSPSRFQPRRHFDENKLRELADSIRRHGIIQPIVVRKGQDDDTTYEILAGERRWRAAQIAKLTKVPIYIHKVNDQTAHEYSLIENIQRDDLTPVEEADAYFQLIETYDYKHEDLSSKLGKSRSYITNMLRLLSLPKEVKDLLGQGLLSTGHARALLGAEDPLALAKEVVEQKLSVRQTEALIKNEKESSKAASKKSSKSSGKQLNEDIVAIQAMLTNSTGMNVKIKQSGNGGQVTIQYKDLEQLDSILQKLSGGEL